MGISTLDGHVGGGTVRLVTGGLPPVGAGTLLERAAWRENASGAILQALCREPRGHDGVTVAVLVEPDRVDADAGVLFFGSAGPESFCGHALIGAVALALDRGLLAPRQGELVRVETRAGAHDVRVVSRAAGRLPRLAFTTAAVTIVRGNQPVTIGRRSARADLVWVGSGAVAIMDAEAAGAPLVATRALELGRIGREVLAHLAEAVRITVPDERTRAPIETVVFIGAAAEGLADVRSASVHADGRVERSPGTPASAAIATVLCAMGMVPPGHPVVHQGLLGPSLVATVESIVDVGGRAVADVAVEADTWATGDHAFHFEAGDPLYEGAIWA